MLYQGTTLENLELDLEKFSEGTEYVQENFEDVTFLYAKGESTKVKEVMLYDPIRPCDQEEFVVGSMKADHTPVRINYSKIPKQILSMIDPEFNPTAANLAFMFDEGLPTERIYFVDKVATHTMHKLPTGKISLSPLTHTKIQLLAENILYLNRDEEMDWDMEDEEIFVGKKTCAPKLTVRIDEFGRKRIMGFLSNNAPDIKIPEYVHMFLQQTGGKIVRYTITDTNITVLVKTKMSGTRKLDEAPCYALHLSDTGHGDACISAGWISNQDMKKKIKENNEIKTTIENVDFYIQSTRLELKAKSVKTLKSEMKATLGELHKELKQQQQKMLDLMQISIPMDDASQNVDKVSKMIANEIPLWYKTVGSKRYKSILNEWKDISGNLTEYEIRKRLLSAACYEAVATSTRQVLSDTIAAQVIGITSPPAKKLASA